MQPQLVRELGSIIRNQISVGRKSVLDAYGDVLFRAWRDSTGLCLMEVENLVQVRLQHTISIVQIVETEPHEQDEYEKGKHQVPLLQQIPACLLAAARELFNNTRRFSQKSLRS